MMVSGEYDDLVATERIQVEGDLAGSIVARFRCQQDPWRHKAATCGVIAVTANHSSQWSPPWDDVFRQLQRPLSAGLAEGVRSRPGGGDPPPPPRRSPVARKGVSQVQTRDLEPAQVPASARVPSRTVATRDAKALHAESHEDDAAAQPDTGVEDTSTRPAPPVRVPPKKRMAPALRLTR